MRLKFFACLVLWACFPLESLGQHDAYFTLNHSKARPLAMGGAFTAIEDDIAAIAYNPAALSLYKVEKPARFTFFLNPVSPVLAALNKDDLYTGEGSTVDDALLTLGLLVKAATFSLGALHLAVVLGEEGLNLPVTVMRDEPVQLSGFRQNHTHSFAGKVNLGGRVYLGGAANLFYESRPDSPLQRHSGWGISYGVILKAEKGLMFGVSYVNMPDSLQSFRIPFERLVDEAVNVGISYRLFKGTLLSLDVRNLGEEQNMAVREFHFGVEQVFLSHVALRAGFYRLDSDRNVFSAGIGLFDGNSVFRRDNHFMHNNFWLNYAFVYESADVAGDSYAHFLSLNFRI